jgi:hypothetical protein
MDCEKLPAKDVRATSIVVQKRHGKWRRSSHGLGKRGEMLHSLRHPSDALARSLRLQECIVWMFHAISFAYVPRAKKKSLFASFGAKAQKSTKLLTYPPLLFSLIVVLYFVKKKKD